VSFYLWCLQDGAFAFFHDLAVTDNYYVLLQNPTRLDFRKLLFEYCVGAFYIFSMLRPCSIMPFALYSFVELPGAFCAAHWPAPADCPTVPCLPPRLRLHIVHRLAETAMRNYTC